MLNVVLILVAYYVMKPVRDVLIFGQQGGPAIKSHAAAAQAMLLAMMVPIRWRIGRVVAATATENKLDYSLMNTVRQMLFLPTTREEKYKAKQVIDTLVVRAGDVLSAGTVYLGTKIIAFGMSHFVAINVAMVLAWRAAAVFTGLEFRRRAASNAEPAQ